MFCLAMNNSLEFLYGTASWGDYYDVGSASAALSLEMVCGPRKDLICKTIHGNATGVVKDYSAKWPIHSTGCFRSWHIQGVANGRVSLSVSRNFDKKSMKSGEVSRYIWKKSWSAADSGPARDGWQMGNGKSARSSASFVLLLSFSPGSCLNDHIICFVLLLLNLCSSSRPAIVSAASNLSGPIRQYALRTMGSYKYPAPKRSRCCERM